MPHVGQRYCHGFEEAEYRRPSEETRISLDRINQDAEIDYLITAESRGMIHVDGSFLLDGVW